jgi:PIN domain nuclease of toxin-antitoxin system
MRTKVLVVLDTLVWATALEHRGLIISRDRKFSGYPELSGVLIAS